ncbi:glycosyltransferase [Neobacillus mesonae]|uniref:glycosyltransferase family 2 protein n=1 Tax=Neobacillus mesonae TaxID=1193713 RepID=UPI0020418E68|nr:glycosyltransferase [Neobacillus mesonae]MCM3568223.1 glycosyltransferase [Neobacillus mesonae]
MNQKVSLVVPIYKVEKYMSRCIESILTQTYKNLEIILVNDGSPDSCGVIADDYAKKDNRIIVVHKENGGLSDARNVGMKYVTGEFTLFVDSDDWLDQTMVEKLVNAITTYQADIVQSAFYYAYEKYLMFDTRVYKRGETPETLDNKEIMKQLVINEKVKNFAWGKLYKTSLIQNIPFKNGVLFEDVFWAHQVMQKVKRFVILHDPLYFYAQREDSIVATYSVRNLDILKGLKERHSFIEKNYGELTNESLKLLLKTNLIHYNLLLRNRKIDSKGLYRKEIRQYIYNHYENFIKAVNEDQALKRQLILFRLHPYLNVLYLVFEKLLRKSRLLSQPSGLEQIEL